MAARSSRRRPPSRQRGSWSRLGPDTWGHSDRRTWITRRRSGGFIVSRQDGNLSRTIGTYPTLQQAKRSGAIPYAMDVVRDNPLGGLAIAAIAALVIGGGVAAAVALSGSTTPAPVKSAPPYTLTQGHSYAMTVQCAAPTSAPSVAPVSGLTANVSSSQLTPSSYQIKFDYVGPTGPSTFMAPTGCTESYQDLGVTAGGGGGAPPGSGGCPAPSATGFLVGAAAGVNPSYPVGAYISLYNPGCTQWDTLTSDNPAVFLAGPYGGSPSGGAGTAQAPGTANLSGSYTDASGASVSVGPTPITVAAAAAYPLTLPATGAAVTYDPDPSAVPQTLAFVFPVGRGLLAGSEGSGVTLQSGNAVVNHDFTVTIPDATTISTVSVNWTPDDGTTQLLTEVSFNAAAYQAQKHWVSVTSAKAGSEVLALLYGPGAQQAVAAQYGTTPAAIGIAEVLGSLAGGGPLPFQMTTVSGSWGFDDPLPTWPAAASHGIPQGTPISNFMVDGVLNTDVATGGNLIGLWLRTA